MVAFSTPTSLLCHGQGLCPKGPETTGQFHSPLWPVPLPPLLTGAVPSNLLAL